MAVTDLLDLVGRRYHGLLVLWVALFVDVYTVCLYAAVPKVNVTLMRVHAVGHFFTHGLIFGIAAVTSTSRNIPPSINPPRTQSSACHQSS